MSVERQTCDRVVVDSTAGRAVLYSNFGHVIQTCCLCHQAVDTAAAGNVTVVLAAYRWMCDKSRAR